MSLNQLSDMNLTPEELADSDAGAGWNLLVPEKAKAGRKKGVARWLERVKIDDAYSEDEIGAQGQTRLLLTMTATVIPGGDSSDNVGRTFNVFLRLNPGFCFKGKKEALGQGDAKKENTMNAMSMKKFKHLMAALGLDLNQPLTGELVASLFPEASDSASGALIGRSFFFQMKDDEGRKQNSGENGQEPEGFLPAGETA